jgi:hypothetical protein
LEPEVVTAIEGNTDLDVPVLVKVVEPPPVPRLAPRPAPLQPPRPPESDAEWHARVNAKARASIPQRWLKGPDEPWRAFSHWFI